MTFDEYIPLAMRTANVISMHNAVLGMIAEIGEIANLVKKNLFQEHPLDRQQMLLEIGDTLYYLAMFCHIVKQTPKLPGAIAEKLPEPCLALAQQVSSLTLSFEADPVGVSYRGRLGGIWERLAALCRTVDGTMEQAMEMNIDKLSRRYPAGRFEAERSLER